MNNEEKILELLSKLSESQVSSTEQLASLESAFEKRLDAWGRDLSGDIKDIVAALTELYALVNGLHTLVKKEHETTRSHINMLIGGQNLLVHQLDSAQNKLYAIENERIKQ